VVLPQHPIRFPSRGKLPVPRPTYLGPYDLTRHEDTIHNAGKQNARCIKCVGSFSRADALTACEIFAALMRLRVNPGVPTLCMRDFRSANTYRVDPEWA
jgi:hypothetical protein